MTDNFKIIAPLERVEITERFATVDTGMSPEDFVRFVLQYVSNGMPMMGVVMQEDMEEKK